MVNWLLGYLSHTYNATIGRILLDTFGLLQVTYSITIITIIITIIINKHH
jgi:hypothetical protein